MLTYFVHLQHPPAYLLCDIFDIFILQYEAWSLTSDIQSIPHSTLMIHIIFSEMDTVQVIATRKQHILAQHTDKEKKFYDKHFGCFLETCSLSVQRNFNTSSPADLLTYSPPLHRWVRRYRDLWPAGPGERVGGPRHHQHLANHVTSTLPWLSLPPRRWWQ